jgi:hypothetical protein
VTSQPQTPEERPSEADLVPEVETDRLPRAVFGYNRATIVELLDSMSNRIRELTHHSGELATSSTSSNGAVRISA